MRRYLAGAAGRSRARPLFLNYKGAGLGHHWRTETAGEIPRDAAGVQLTAHQLRHNFANDLVWRDVPVTSIQKLMGHAWLATTQTYIEANDPKVRQDFYAGQPAAGGLE